MAECGRAESGLSTMKCNEEHLSKVCPKLRKPRDDGGTPTRIVCGCGTTSFAGNIGGGMTFRDETTPGGGMSEFANATNGEKTREFVGKMLNWCG